MALFAQKPRAVGGARLPKKVAADDGRFLTQHATGLQVAGAAKPRRTHTFARDAYGHYVEPLWCSARLFEAESFGAPGARVYDPACGWGRVLHAAKGAGYTPIGSDVVDRRGEPQAFADIQFTVCDFLIDTPVRAPWSIVSNPPFDYIPQFCERALDIATHKVAMLMQLRRLPAAHYLQRLPLETVYSLTPRPSMPPASYIAAGKKPGNGSQDFCWLIFNKRAAVGREPRLRWLRRDRGAP
jgi:hypothetical protein